MQIATRNWAFALVALLALAGTFTTVCAVAHAQGDESGQDLTRKGNAQFEFDRRMLQRFQQLEAERWTLHWEMAGWSVLCAHVRNSAGVDSKLWAWLTENDAFDPPDHDARRSNYSTVSSKAWEVEKKLRSSGWNSQSFSAWEALHKRLRLTLPRMTSARKLRKFVEESVPAAYDRLEEEAGPPNAHWEFMREWDRRVNTRAETLGVSRRAMHLRAGMRADSLRYRRLLADAAREVAALTKGDRFDLSNPHAWIAVLLDENARLRERIAILERARGR